MNNITTYYITSFPQKGWSVTKFLKVHRGNVYYYQEDGWYYFPYSSADINMYLKEGSIREILPQELALII